MVQVGVICEYNPLHLGHQKQLQRIRQRFGPDCGIVCLMSGDYVQRGAPAIFGKMSRARAAVLCGADLVLELPVTCALSSAEGFAGGGVGILSGLCDTLCFGTENGDAEGLFSTAEALLSPDFSVRLKETLATGVSFPAARQAALEQMGASTRLVQSPNDILAVEYCKAILSQGSAMTPYPIRREGSYHAETADSVNPSATAVRRLMLSSHDWKSCIPRQAQALFDGAPLHTLTAGERAVLAKLRTMTEAEFEALPYGSEGLWRKLMHACRTESTLDGILTAAKSKRYTRTRLDRMVLCAFLGITGDMLTAEAPYARVLAFNDRGRELLNGVKKSGYFRNPGERMDFPYWELEQRCGRLYGLFCTGEPEPPEIEEERRVRYLRPTP